MKTCVSLPTIVSLSLKPVYIKFAIAIEQHTIFFHVDQLMRILEIGKFIMCVSFGFGILLVDWLNQIQIGGFKLGFWFAQQGSIYVFIVLIFYYARAMHKLDLEFNVQERD